MKIRVISDLHIDVNKKYISHFEWADKDILTIIAGDTAGSLEVTAPFIRKWFNNAILIGGNHIVYNKERKSIQQLYMDYKTEFPLTETISFLENDYKVIDDAVFIGATLWTDYAYNGNIEDNIDEALHRMNDFQWGIFKDANGKNISLRPKHLLGMFRESLAFIKESYDQFAGSGKKIILAVHHGVSPKAIKKEYRYSSLSAAYISDLESYIINNMPELSLIVHGHIHKRVQYKIGNIPVICNPCGYIDYSENENIPAWDKNLIVEV